MFRLVQTLLILAVSVALGLYAASSAAAAIGWGGAGDSGKACPMTGSTETACPYSGAVDDRTPACPFSNDEPSPAGPVPQPIGPRDEA